MKGMKDNIAKYIPAVVFILSVTALLLRARYSFCWSDETFYSSTAYRFYLGDRPFADEWFPTQLSSVLLLPFLSAFIGITGSTEGIILYFRILYVLFSATCCLGAFMMIKKKRSLPEAMAVSMGILYYVHLNIATLSYYSVSTLCFLMAMLILYTYPTKKVMCIMAGVFLTLTMAAIPTMALPCILMALLAFMLWGFAGLLPRRMSEAYERTELRTILPWTVAGAAAAGAVFMIWLLMRVSLPDILSNVHYLLSDEEHGTSLIYPLKKFFISINEIYGTAAYMSYLLILILIFAGRAVRRHAVSRVAVLGAASLLFAAEYILGFGHTGYVNTALCLFALPLFLITEHKDLRSFWTLFFGGIIFTLVYSYSSNGYLYVLSQGHFICAVSGIMMICDLAGEWAADEAVTIPAKRAVSVISKAAVLIFVITSMLIRMINVYRDAPLSELSVMIDRGPAKGLYTTASHRDSYDEVYDTITGEFRGEGCVFISKLLPFGYMCTDMRPGAYTTWRTGADSERLAEYYSLYPHRIPEKILILKEGYGSYETSGDVVADPAPNENASEGPLYDMIDRLGYEKKDTVCGTVYTRKH